MAILREKKMTPIEAQNALLVPHISKYAIILKLDRQK
jgi:hypothetical protein